MRNRTLAGAILSVCSLAVPASAQSYSTQFYTTQSHSTQHSTQSLTDQMIPASERAHDFGTVARAAKTEHRFEIRNPLQKPIHLRSISASCGCTTPIIESEWIQPGQVGTVLARFNTGTFTGDRKASLNLFIDQPSNMQLQLNVKGYIRSDIVINPGELNFGNVPLGDSKQIVADIEYAGRNDWKLTGVSSNVDFIDATLTETSRKPGRVAYKITATLAPGSDPGPQAAELILHPNDSRLKTVPLCCVAQIEAPLTVSPNNVTLGEMKPGQAIQQRLLIKGATPFEVIDISVPHMEVLFDRNPEAKTIQFLNLTLIPDDDSRSGEVRTTMTIRAEMDGEQEITLDISYKIVPAPAEITPDKTPLSNKVSSRAHQLLTK